MRQEISIDMADTSLITVSSQDISNGFYADNIEIPLKNPKVLGVWKDSILFSNQDGGYNINLENMDHFLLMLLDLKLFVQKPNGWFDRNDELKEIHNQLKELFGVDYLDEVNFLKDKVRTLENKLRNERRKTNKNTKKITKTNKETKAKK